MVKGIQAHITVILVPMVLVGCFQELTSAEGGALLVVSGDNQLGVVQTALPTEIRVRLADADGFGIAGRRVTFFVVSGGGSVSPLESVTDLNGEAATTWTLGAVAGEHELRVSSAAFPSVSVTATAELTLFDVDVRFLSPVTDAQRTAFRAATTRWRRIVTGDLADVPIMADAGQCGANSPALNETVDDLILFVFIEPVDGVGGSLANAGPCFVRTSDRLPLIGSLRLDQDDLSNLEQTGDLETVVHHEMGHVLGFGTLWNDAGLLADPAEQGGIDPHFTGRAAIDAFDANGGAAYPGSKVPVENTGGTGTYDGHWREAILDAELMTGFLDPGKPNPLSNITVASLADLGYSVNPEAADAFTVTISTPSGAVHRTAPLQLINDVYTGPIHQVLPDGTLRRIR